MSRITGKESRAELPEKVLKIYDTVKALIEEGADITGVKVSEITGRAGIGKGTAYDYFSTKEEMIVYALLFCMEDYMTGLEAELFAQEGFANRVQYALEIMERKAEAPTCMLRFVNLMFDASPISVLLRETLQKRMQSGECQPFMIIKRLVIQGVETGEIMAELPIKYMAYILSTKMVSYHTFMVNHINNPEDMDGLSPEGFRKYVLNGILEEFDVRV